MRQTAGDQERHLNAQAGAIAAPTGDVGIDVLTAFSGAAKVRKWLVTVEVGGTGSIEVALYGRLKNLWGALGSGDGKLNSGVAIAAGETRHFELENLGGFDRLYTRTMNATGSPTTSTWVAELLEKGD